MKNEEIIRAEVQKHFTPAQIHELAAAYCDPQEIAARVAGANAAAVVVDQDGNKIDPTPAVELDLVAAQFHTVKKWNESGRCVKRGEKNAFKAMIWQRTNKPNAAARKAAAENGKDLPDDPHYYLAPAWFFHLGQTQPQAAAPAKMTAEDLKAKNAQLMAAYKAYRAAEKAAAQQQPTQSATTTQPAPKAPATQPAPKAATKLAAKRPARKSTAAKRPARKAAIDTTTDAAQNAIKTALVSVEHHDLTAPSAAPTETDFAALAASILF